MNKVRNLVAIICAFTMLFGALSVVSCAADAGCDYVINNPYENVDFSSFKQYKADLHSHTTASDGTNTLKEMLEAHYNYDFDIVAVSDHGLSSYSWTSQEVLPAMAVVIELFKNRGGAVEALNKDGGSAANGSTYSLVTKNGGDYYSQTTSGGVTGQEMMRVPFAIENNPTSLNNAHVNSFFVDYGNKVVGGTSDYETPIKNVDELGGVSVINHPGEYTNARDEETTAAAYDYSDTHYKYCIDKFTSLLSSYNSCIGIDVNSKGDQRTRYDRKLWDILLMNVVPTGRNVYGLATSDAHSVEAVYSGYTEMLMPENTVANLESCMKNGEFFAASKYLGNPEEITEIANIMIKSGNKTGSALGDKLLNMQKEDANAKYAAPTSVEAPVITNVSVNEKDDTITLSAKDSLCVRWISNGVTIATGNSIDLDNYSSEIGSYVRAEVFGEGGIVYVQPFTLEYSGSPEANNVFFVDLWMAASIIPDTIVRFLVELPVFEMLYKLMH